jgi:heptosyltransferase-3
VGDSLLATPALETLRKHLKNAKIDLLAHRNRLNIFENSPHIKVLGSISEKRSWFKGWFSAKKYDYVIIFNYGNDQKNIVRFALRVGKKVIASATSNQKLNAKLFYCIPRKKNHHILNYMGYLAPFKIKEFCTRIQFILNDEEKEFASSLLNRHKFSKSRFLVGYQMISFPARSYRDWPVNNFQLLAEKILNKKPNAFFLIFGSKEDQDKITQFTKHMPIGSFLDLTGLSLRKTAAIMSLIDLYVGVDTGPTHMMSAFDVPMVAMYHGKFPSKYYAPIGHPNCVVIDHPKMNKCTDKDTMADISVDHVFLKLKKFL